MRKSLFFLFVVLINCHAEAFSQTELSYTLVAEIAEKSDFIATDNMGFIYLYDATNIKKYNEKGNLLFTYSALSMGRISSVDVSNPFKIMVFSKDFARLLFLDNKLVSGQSAYILSDLNTMPACVCMSYDNGFWVYDESVKQLFRYDAQYNLQNTSSLISNLVEKDAEPISIKESNNHFLLMNDKENGILVFDRFGTFLKLIPIFVNHFHVYNNQIIYVENDELHFVDIQTMQQGSMALPEKGIRQICIEKQRLVALTKDNMVKIFKIEIE